jgi:demethylmacrocin O-methyltransferase
MNISSKIKALLKENLNELQKRQVKHLLSRFLFFKDLCKIAKLCETDKESGHHYAKHYQRHFESLRRERLNILEIGIGGYENPNEGGESLRMWKIYFPKSCIFGIDIYDKTCHDEYRIKTFRGSQVDELFLRNVVEEIGTIDIIIDDGSHLNDHVITTFRILFPLMSSNGIYVVEDLQTSYWDNFGGSTDLTASHTSMNFLKSLIDGLNCEEFTFDEYVPNYFDKHIISMHFYHNLAFIYKGLNNEGSNRRYL